MHLTAELMSMRNNAQFRVVLLLWLAISLSELFAFPFPFFPPYTSQQDVYAINDLYTCLGSPALAGWTAYGGDPCTEAWEGVQCVGPNITRIVLKGANLEGKLSETLANFTSVITLDLSNNHIGGTIPQKLPPSIRELDLSSNNLSGRLPDSMEKLNSLSKLHVQNNQLSGTLDVLGDLPLKDLSVENNLFSGSIPEKLLSIPNFQRDGNHFIIPIPDPPSTTMIPLQPNYVPPPQLVPSNPSVDPHNAPRLAPSNPSVAPYDVEHKKKISPAKAVGYGVLAASSLIIATLLVMFSISKWKHGEIFHGGYLRAVEMSAPKWMKNPPQLGTFAKADKEPEKVTIGGAEEKIEHTSKCSKTMALPIQPFFKNSSMDSFQEKIEHTSKYSDDKFQRTTESQSLPFSLTFFSVASLQQYTNNFIEGNMIRETNFGKTYLAEHSESKLAVLKLDDKNAKIPADDFVKLVQGISQLQHPNIDELVGCCAEYGQRLLVYRYFSEKTLHDMIHFEDDPSKKLSWNARIRVALESAKALEYLHEGCQKQVFHQHVNSENVLINGELGVRVSGCGLAPFISSGLILQLSDCCETLSYEPPELSQSALWTEKSDIYSFGVVMLELLTGRKPYGSSRALGEQHLVRWASTQLYDINALEKMVDPCINGRLSVRSLSRFADVISQCIQQEPEFRPLMSQVVQDLSRTLDDALTEEQRRRSSPFDRWRCSEMRSGLSSAFNSATAQEN